MTDYTQLRLIVRGMYAMQRQRVSAGNRLCAQFRSKLGIEPGQKEEASDEDAQKLLKVLRESYKKITDGVVVFPKRGKWKGDGVIDSESELLLVHQYMLIESHEDEMEKRLRPIVREFPVWDAFFLGVRGCGELMAACILADIDIERATTVSKIWKYCGVDVAPDGKGRSRKKEHLIKREYTDAKGVTEIRDSITYNPKLKTKLLGVLGGCMLKAGKDSKYTQLYYDEKNRLENHEVYKDTTPLHRHRMATRKMIKLFLMDLYAAWRECEGLPVREPYAEEYLGRKHAV